MLAARSSKGTDKQTASAQSLGRKAWAPLFCVTHRVSGKGGWEPDALRSPFEGPSACGQHAHEVRTVSRGVSSHAVVGTGGRSLPFGPDIPWLSPQGAEPSLHSVYSSSESLQVLLEPRNQPAFPHGCYVGVLQRSRTHRGCSAYGRFNEKSKD